MNPPPTYTARDVSRIVADVLRAAYDEGAIGTTPYLNLMFRFTDEFTATFGMRFDRGAFVTRCVCDNKRFSEKED